MTMQAGPVNDSMAALTRGAADRYGDRVAARYKRGDNWDEITYAELWDRVQGIALGLVDLGVGVGDRVCVLANTRLEFTIVDLAASTAGAIVVPVYPTNSADECEWVVGNSGATLIFCENESQVAKIDEVRAGLPDLQHIVVIDGHPTGTMTLEEVAARGADGDASELERRAARRRRPTTPA